MEVGGGNRGGEKKKKNLSLGSVLFEANMPSWTWSGELQILS